MTSSIKVGNVQAALSELRFPTVTVFNRLEGRPRTLAFDRALRAEVRDPLWMLTKQWQMGEFRGADAGSPVSSRLLLQTTRLTKYQPDGHSPTSFPYEMPLQTRVERRPVSFASGSQVIAFDMRLTMGRYWRKLIASLPNDYSQTFIDAYFIRAPDPSDVNQAEVCAHLEAWQPLEAVATRAMDGGALYVHLTDNTAHHAYDNVNGVDPNDFLALDDCAKRFVAWFRRTVTQPESATDDAWLPPHLEYQFAASAPIASGGEKVYSAQEYYQGRLDWYSLDVDGATATLPPVPGSESTGLPADVPNTTIPTPVSFAGMANTRWWTFEERAINFGDIDAATTDLSKLLFIEFALVYANDWFVIPCTLPSGSLAEVRGLAVTNSFGERVWIGAAGSGADDDWQRWSMFTINVNASANAASDTTLAVLPTAAKVLPGPTLEDVLLVRDEAANIVWGIESTISLAHGEPKRGAEAARERLTFYENFVAQQHGGTLPVSPIPASAPTRYRLMSSVPENWIPFIPVHIANDNREIQLQRAALPRIIGNDPNALPASLSRVKPRTTLLREGLDATTPQAYYLFEEEVPRAGARVFRSFQRTRWLDGQVYTWLRVQKQTGRGEGSSGLAFDRLEKTD